VLLIENTAGRFFAEIRRTWCSQARTELIDGFEAMKKRRPIRSR